MSVPAIPANSLLRYGFIAMPAAFAGFPLYVLAPDFYATRHGLSLTLLGGVLLALRLLDAVQDPLLGWCVDRLQGRLLRLLFGAAVILCGSIFALFNFGLFETAAISPVWWFAGTMVLAVSAYSLISIILGAAATLWTEDRHDQTRIASAREGFALLGLVIAVSLPALLTQIAGRERAFLWYAVVLGLAMAAGLVAFPRVEAAKALPQEPVSLLAAMRALPKESLKLFGVYGLSMLASALPAVLVVFFVRDRLGGEAFTGLFLLLYFLTGAAAMPVWKVLSRRIGKYRSWAFSNSLAVAGFAGAFFLGTGDLLPFAVICLLSGFALGADLSLPPALLADQIHAKGNARFSATHYAFLALAAKISLACASAFAFPILDAAGFKPQQANAPEALFALSLTYAAIPCALKLSASALIVWVFPKTA